MGSFILAKGTDGSKSLEVITNSILSSKPIDGSYSINGKIYTNNDSCGLEWDGSLSSGERNAKFDCDPAWDEMIISEFAEK